MKKRVRLTESDLHRIVKESVNRILKESFGKGEKYTYKTKDGDTVNCEFITSTFEDGYPYSVGLINHNKKEVYPCHGYHYPNRCAKGLMNTALSLGYTYVDSEMPSKENKTLLKKYNEKVLKESIGVFEVYTNDYMKGSPVYVRVGEDFYKLPQEMNPMLGELDTKQGRMTFIDAITNGEIPSCNIDILKLKGHGYKGRAFNANAF